MLSSLVSKPPVSMVFHGEEETEFIDQYAVAAGKKWSKVGLNAVSF